MKLTVQLQLIPDPEAARKLRVTVERFNEAANFVAGIAFDQQTANQFALRSLSYRHVRERFGLSSQMAQLAIKNVCDAYRRDRAKRVTFREHAAVVYDQRTMSFKGLGRVSLLTLEGRVVVPFLLGRYQAERFTNAKGQADLVLRRDGRWFLLVSVDLPDGTPVPSTDFVGVDLGIVNLAATSDGETFGGEAIEATRRRYGNRRSVLQRAAAGRRLRGRRPKAIRRALRRASGREANFRRDHNHVIAKTLVKTAKRTERGIALENLTHIRRRVTAKGGDARNRLHGWAFFQLRSFLAYKAKLAGVILLAVDPRDTSRTCGECGVVDKASRRSQSEFRCSHCGHAANADINAARAIRAKALVMAPQVSERASA